MIEKLKPGVYSRCTACGGLNFDDYATHVVHWTDKKSTFYCDRHWLIFLENCLDNPKILSIDGHNNPFKRLKKRF